LHRFENKFYFDTSSALLRGSSLLKSDDLFKLNLLSINSPSLLIQMSIENIPVSQCGSSGLVNNLIIRPPIENAISSYIQDGHVNQMA